LLVRAYDENRNELIGDDIFLYVHEPRDTRATGSRPRPIVVARSGEELILSAGEYDLRLEDTRAPGPGIWLSGVLVEAGKRNELSVSFERSTASPRGPYRGRRAQIE
jgi:hypothetical protein